MSSRIVKSLGNAREHFGKNARGTRCAGAFVGVALALTGCGFNPCLNGGDIHTDTDGDTVPDCVEQGGVDINNDGVADAVTNTNPRRKDVFIKLDWMECGSDTSGSCADGHTHSPNAQSLQDVTDAYAAAPVSNPDGSTGIDMHIEMGEALAHQDICGCDCIANLVDSQRQILSSAERASANANELFEAKRKIVHYFLWDHQHDSSSSSGVACPNGYTHVSLGLWGGYGNRTDQAGTFMHELGHQIGLPHGGTDGVNNKPNYLSVMNYSFQTSYTGRLAALDYSHSDLDDLNEDNLNEPVGIGANTATLTRFFNRTRDLLDVSSQGGIDWDQDGVADDVVNSGLDLNNDGVCVTTDTDGVLDSRKSGDDQYFAKNRAGWMVLSDTTRAAQGDDDKFVDAASGETRISTGANAILDTPVLAGDVLKALAIVDGPDHTCDSAVNAADKQVQAPGTAETRVLTGHDDWANINLGLLFSIKGGFGATPPSSLVTPSEPELTFEQAREMLTSDVVVEVVPTFTARRGVLTYDVVVSNAGPEHTDGPVHVDLALPATASNISCQAPQGGTCVPTTTGDKILIDAPELAPGDSRAFQVTLHVDATLCATPDAYTAGVSSSIANIEIDHVNDTYAIPFPDVDGDGTIDVCGWPITDFSVYGLSACTVGNRGVISEAAGAFAHGLVGKRDVGDLTLGAFRVGVTAVTGDVLTNGSLLLDRDSVIDGNVVAGGRVAVRQGVQISGTLSQGVEPSPALPALELAIDWSTPSSGDVLVAPSASVALPPGRYGIVSIATGSDLFLGAGDYAFDQLSLVGRIHFDTSGGPIRVFVHTNLVLTGQWLNPDPGGVLLAYAGVNAVSVETSLGATILAPFASVSVGTGTVRQFAGAVLAREVVIRPDAVLTHIPFRGTWPFNP